MDSATYFNEAMQINFYLDHSKQFKLQCYLKYLISENFSSNKNLF